MTDTVNTSEAITITEAAADKVRQLLIDRGLPDHCLRVYVAGFGCAGPQYGLALDEGPQDSDSVVESDGIRILVDPNSMVYLQGASIEYAETPQGAGFRIENTNPMAAAACGSCGSQCG